MTQLLRKRFDELDAQSAVLAKTKSVSQDFNRSTTENVNREQFLAWCVKARNLLVSACGHESEHYKAFVEAENYASWSGNVQNFLRTTAVFGAAKEDFEGGYLASVRKLVQAEVFENELEQARELLSAGYHPAAAVVAGVVLETTLRQLCTAQGISLGKLDKMNADLAKAGHYNSLVQKRVTSLAAIRNSAAHGDHAAFTKGDVDSMVDDIERLVSQWLS